MKDLWKPTAFDREGMARALLEQLGQENGQWVAIRVQGTGWEIVRPRTQEALLAALETIEPAASAIEARRAETAQTDAVHESAVPLWKMRTNIRHHLMTGLIYRSTGKDPKNDGYTFAEVPDWQLRQWLQIVEQAASAIEKQDAKEPSAMTDTWAGSVSEDVNHAYEIRMREQGRYKPPEPSPHLLGGK